MYQKLFLNLSNICPAHLIEGLQGILVPKETIVINSEVLHRGIQAMILEKNHTTLIIAIEKVDPTNVKEQGTKIGASNQAKSELRTSKKSK